VDNSDTCSLLAEQEQPAMEIAWEDFILETANK
jgi:hypothetical protein